MDKYTLVGRDDWNVGLGIMIDDVPQMQNEPMVAQSGLLIAHDIMEHPNGFESIGSIDDELEALGGVHYIRGEGGQISKKVFTSSYEALKYDIAHLAEFYMRGVEFRRPWKNCADSDYFEFFQMITDYARPTIKEYIESELEYSDLDRSYMLRRMEEMLIATPHYMVMGYRKTRERFPCQEIAMDMFWKIADAVDPYAQSCEFEGERFTLCVDWEAEKVSCFRNEEDLLEY